MAIDWKGLLPAITSLSVWLVLNCSLNFYNKWLFAHTDFKFPVFFTMFHMIANLLGSSILIFGFGASKVDLAKDGKHMRQKWAILLLACLFCTNIVTNNWSLMYVSLSVNQIVKSCLPIPTVIFSLLFEGKTYDPKQYIAIAVIVSGSIVAVVGNMGYDAFGFALVTTSTVCVAAWTITSAKLLDPDSGLDSKNLLFYGSIPSLFLLLGLWSLTDEFYPTIAFLQENPVESAIYISIGGGMAFVYNIFHFLLIKYTSTVTSTVAGNMKIILVILLSVMFLEKPLSPTNWMGIGIFLIGVFSYAYMAFKAKMAAKNAQAPAADEEAVATEATPLKK